MAARTRSAPPYARGTRTWIDPQITRKLATMDFIQNELSYLAQSLQLQARNHLAQHRDESDARILLKDHPNGIDRLVILEDTGENPNALAIEFGHWTTIPQAAGLRGVGTSHYVAGLNILGSLVGLDPFYRPGGR